MAAIQQLDRINFGSARVFETPAGGGAPVLIANITDVSADFKCDLKEAFGENSYPIAVADGHRSIDITGKHYTIRPETLASATNGSISTGATPYSLDEAGVVPASTPYTVPLAQAAQYVAGSLYLVVFVMTNGIAVPTKYNIVAAGSEAAGVSASITAGVLKFAAGDTGLTFQASYAYTPTVAVGTRVTIQNGPQNSGKTFQLVAVKRDTSPLDNSVGQLIFTFPNVRLGGMKPGYKEGDFTTYERTYKAFANAAGLVGYADFVNV